MSGFTRPFRRVDTAKGHHYVDAEGRRVPGVTTIIGDGVPKPALINWAANSTAEYAVDRWDELAQLTPTARLKRLQGARYEVKDMAANKGTAVHTIAEQLIAGRTVQVPDELRDYAHSYVRFLDEFNVKPMHVEFSVFSYHHGYAGTGDLIGEITHPKWGTRLVLGDVKTSRSGIFGETALQLAGYRYGDVLVPKGEADEQDMPDVDGCVGVWVRPDGYSLMPITADEDQLHELLYAREVGRFVRDSRDLIGAPIDPPTASTYRLTREEWQ